MKKLAILLLLPFFIACSSDNNSEPEPEPKEPEQDYTSFVFMQPHIDVEPNVVIGYKTAENTYKKVTELGNLKKNEYSKEVRVENNITILYYFSDYNGGIRSDATYTLKKNIKNIFIPSEDTKGIKVNKEDPTQYPQ